MLNHIYITFKLHPDWDWDWRELSMSPSITWEMIQEFSTTNFNQNQTLNWDYEYVSCNPNITWTIVKNNLDKKWDWHYLSTFLKPEPDYLESGYVRWGSFSYNDNLTQEIYLKYQDKPWSYNNLSEQNWLTWNFIINNLNKEWNWVALCQNKYLTRDIEKTWTVLNSELKHIYNKYTGLIIDNLSGNPNLTWGLVSRNMILDQNHNWNWRKLSSVIDIKIITENPDYKWSYWMMSYNPTLTWKVIKQNITTNLTQICDWNWNILTRFINVKRYNKYRNIGNNIYEKIIKNKYKALEYKYVINDKEHIYRLMDTNSGYKNILIKIKYFNLWLKNSRKIKQQREHWKVEFTASVDFLSRKLTT